MATTFLAGLIDLSDAHAGGSPFVLQCADDETIARIVVRAGRRIDFLGIECRKPGSNVGNIYKTGGQGGTRHEFKFSGQLHAVEITKGRCNAGSERVCSIRFETSSGQKSNRFGTDGSMRKTLGNNGEIYGFYGRSGAELDDLDVLTRKVWAKSDREINTEKFMSIVNTQMRGAMGYAAVLQNRNGERIGLARAGWAIHPLDRTLGPYAGPYHIHAKTAVGSTTKVFATAAAALHIDQRKSDTNVLEQYFESYLPYRWRQGLHPRFKRVTVLDLIQHKAGMVHTGGRPARERLSDGDGAGPNTDDPLASGENPCNRTPPPVGSSCYSNSAGGMFHFILPYMMSHQLTFNEEQKVRNEPNGMYDAKITAFTGQYYYDYVQKFILAPAGVEANCNARAFLGKRPVVAGYVSSNDRTGSLPADNTRNCASGGWVLSVNDLARVLHALTQTDKILNAESRKRFLGSNDKRVWWWRINVLDGRAHWHNGGIADMSTDMIVFPNGYQMVIATNSKGKDLSGILIRAYNRSRRS